MTTFKFAKIADGRYRTTIDSDFGVVKNLVQLLTDHEHERSAARAQGRARAVTAVPAEPVDQDGPDCEGPEGGEPA